MKDLRAGVVGYIVTYIEREEKHILIKTKISVVCVERVIVYSYTTNCQGFSKRGSILCVVERKRPHIYINFEIINRKT